MRNFGLLSILTATVFVTGCLGDKQKPPPKTDTASLSSVTLVAYDATNATLNIRGSLKLEAMTNFNVVNFHLEKDCSDSPRGTGLQEDFIAGGIHAVVPAMGTSKIYVSSNTIIGCYYVAQYTPDYEAPPPPVLVSTSPVSPSQTVTTPAIYGTAAGFAVSLRFFDDAGCTNEVGTGTTDEFQGTGVLITVSPNQTTHLFSIATEPFGHASACEEIGTYRHFAGGPVPPVYAAVLPASPNKTSTTPSIKGTSSAATVTVKLFSDAACTAELASGTKADFEGAGLAVSVTADSVTSIYALAVDTNGDHSICNYMTSYVHDTVAPATPVYVSANPVSPTAATLYPRVKGTASADTATVKIYSSVACITSIGSGTKAEFEGAGVLTTVIPNTTTTLYASNVDAAGNASACVHMADYTHDTLPPDPPVFSATSPISPNNQSTTPVVTGNASTDTVEVRMYTDEFCTQQAGSGTGLSYASPGITATVPGNTTTTIYAAALDNVGNISSCAEQTTYAHSTVPAPPPSFLQTVPASPSRASYTPYVIGTAPTIVSKVTVYGDGACTAQLGQASRILFSTSGIQVTLAPNTIYNLFAKSLDVYGNDSACTAFTTYTHNNIPPLNPSFTATNPASPNNITAAPFVTGTTTLNPASVLPPSSVSIYDSFLCLNRVAQGTPAAFASAGLETVLPPNMVSNLYARVFDAAGNQSSCTHMTDYTYVNIKPGRPIFASSTPATPSYTAKTNVVGSLASSANFLAVASVNLFSDSSCTSLMATGSQSAFQTGGITVDMHANATTTLYGNSVDPVGNTSLCNQLVDFVHSDVPPANLSATAKPDGSVGLNWIPDLTANPAPRYVVKRSTNSGGPYTILTSSNSGSSYTDKMVKNNTTYYYVVASTNNTGTSLNSTEVSVLVAPPTPAVAASLNAVPGDGTVTLAWTGFNSDMEFSLYRSIQRGGPYTLLKGGMSAMNYVDSAVTLDVPYYYVVIGTNPSGESAQSNEASAVPLGAPNAPADLQILPLLSSPSCGGGPGVLLTWSAPNYYSRFVVKRGGSPGQTGYYSYSAGTSYTDCFPYNSYTGGLVDSYYTVTAAWGTNESVNSNEVGFVNMAQPVLTVRPGNGEIFLTWTNPSTAPNFRILRSQNAGGPYTAIVPSTAVANYTDSAVVNGQPYYYVIESTWPSLVTWPSIEQSGVPGVYPVAPTNLTMTVDTTKKPLLSWTAPANYNVFNVYRAAAPAGPYTFISSANAAQYNDTSPLAGMNYYKVTATWGNYETGFSNIVSFRGGAPNTLTASPVASDIALSWSAVTSATNYNVLRGMQSGGPYSLVATSASTTFTDTTSAPTIGYYYVVTANFADSTVSQSSPEASVMENGSVIPSGLTVTGTTGGTVSLTWARVAGAATYRITRSTTAGGTYTQVATGITQTNTVLSSLLSATTYYFKVIAVVSGTPSSPSNYVAATTLTGPSAPSVSPGNNSVMVQWSSVTGALSYAVERSTDGMTFTGLASGIPSINFTDSTAVNGTLYFYRIVATYSTGSPLISAMSTAVTPGTLPLVPAALTVTDNSSGVDLLVSWPKVSGATSYSLYLSTTSGGPYGAAALTTSSTTGVTLLGLTPNTTYYLALSALNGTRESALSPETAVHTLAQPAAPAVIAASATAFNVSWGAVAGAGTYDLQRSDDNSYFTTIAAGLAGTTFSDTTVLAPSSYSYRYLPKRPGGVPMAVSNSSSLATSGIAPLPPPGFTALATSTTVVKLDWVQVPNASQYRLYRGTVSGGPYTALNTIPSASTTYTDSTALAGNTYYYVATSLTVSGAESIYSNQEIVRTTAGPATLNAVIGANASNLTWAAVGSASSYVVRRSEISGGPYGTIASGIAGTSYSDTNVEHGHIYYYVVDAVFASGAVSVHSPEATATAVNTMNLQVPIELTDQGISSTTTALNFERTRTSLDTADYDGTVTYYLEAVVANYDATAKNVGLVNAAGTSIGLISVPGNTNAPTRMRAAVTPTAGADTYRLRLSATTSIGLLQVFSARLLVDQVGASKTKLYFPLLSSGGLPNESDLLAPVQSSQSATFNSLPTAGIFRRDVTHFARIVDYNAWTLETLVAADAGSEGSVALLNTSQGSQIVEGTQSIFSNNAVTMVQSNFDEGISLFAAANQGDDYEVSLQCRVNCTTGSVSIYKAGLWLTLSNLSKAEVVYRDSLALPLVSNPTVNPGGRTLINLSSFSNPVVVHQAVGSLTMGSGPSTVRLNTVSTNDSGTASLTPVVNSDLNFSSPTKQFLSSPPLSIPSGNRVMPDVDPNGSTFNLNNSSIVIRATR